MRMHPTASGLILGAALSLVCAMTANAQITDYTYTGNDFTTGPDWTGLPQSPFTTSDHVELSILLSAPLLSGQEQLIGIDPLAGEDFTFSDGVESYDLDTHIDGTSGPSPRYFLFDLTTSQAGAITNWQIELLGGSNSAPELFVCNQGAQILANQCGTSEIGDYVVYALFPTTIVASNSSRGSWTATAVPEGSPGWALLAICALVMGIGLRMRSKRRLPSAHGSSHTTRITHVRVILTAVAIVAAMAAVARADGQEYVWTTIPGAGPVGSGTASEYAGTIVLDSNSNTAGTLADVVSVSLTTPQGIFTYDPTTAFDVSGGNGGFSWNPSQIEHMYFGWEGAYPYQPSVFEGVGYGPGGLQVNSLSGPDSTFDEEGSWLAASSQPGPSSSVPDSSNLALFVSGGAVLLAFLYRWNEQRKKRQSLPE